MSNNKILVLDDEPAVGQLISRIAVHCGFTAIPVITADEFDNIRGDWQPSIIVLDLQMPDVDGIEILRKLAEAQSQAQIIIMSGFDEKVIQSARHLGIERGLKMIATIQKPFRADELERVLIGLRRGSDVIDEASIRAAIDANAFHLVYQPKIDLQKTGANPTHRTVGFEALLRWTHATRGIIAPADFLPIMEAAGMMDDVTDLVFSLALQQQRIWRNRGIQTSIAVNISAQNLHATDFTDQLVARCRECEVPPESLIIELTETAAMIDAAMAMDILTRLRLKGFRLSIDDFGTGYSSLVQLHLLPFSELKIDRAFIRDCGSSRQSEIIVKTMIDLGKNLGLAVVAEGIEDASALQVVRELGCDYGQGFYVSRPLSAEAAEQWIRGARD
ncbi:MAG: EAL domain-containing protein [Rhodospirillaceae bacterium]|nr:MAG: EAL domain-containing protein [Rhodospirillaceae bacterium]